jgi:uncharacterized repeat protein (TIGR01451 family)
VVLALQLVAVGLLATGAFGTGQDTPQIAAQPQLSSLLAAGHDESVPLAAAPDIPNDPTRQIPEFERQAPAVISPATPDAALQSSVAGPAVSAPVAGFDALSRLGIASPFYPPDTVGDVGPDQYVQAVNGGIDVFSKTGTSLTGGVTDTAFWSGLSGCSGVSLSDPTVNYDQFADRWVYGELAYTLGSGSTYSGPFTECVAVSSTGDATGTWNRYAFNIDAPTYRWLPDYPKLGVWPDGYYLSFNDYDSTSPHGFVGAGAMVLERSAMLTGASAQAIFFDLRGVSGLEGGMLPADADGAAPPPPGAPNLYVTPVDSSSNDQLGLWAFHVDWAVPSNSSFTNPQALAVTAYDGYGASVAQPSTAVKLDSLADDRLMNRVQYRNFGGYETLVLNETVNTGSSIDAPRWYELRRTSGAWTVNQQSTFQPDTVNRWMGSAAMNGSGDIALAYSAGDSGTFPALRYTGRASSDGLSTMQTEATLVAGGGSQTGTTRWGDYSQLSVDPADDCTFWFTGEYYGSTSAMNWSTRIGSFRVSSCTTTGPQYSVVPVVSGTLREGSALATTDGTWSPAPASYAYQWRRCDSTGIACTDINGATFNTYLLTSADAGKRLRVKVTATQGGNSNSVLSAVTGTILPLAPVNTSIPTITGTPQVAVSLVAATGSWTSALTPSYTYQWQRCSPGCADINAATGVSYTLQAADAGATVRVGVTAQTTGGTTGPVYSSQTATVQLPPAPTVVVMPSISGTAQDAHTLTAVNGTWAGVTPISFTYQWLRCNGLGSSCVAITGQNAVTYGVGTSDVGSTIRVAVTATNAGGATQQNTLATSVVVPVAPVSTGVPLLSGSPAVGSALTTTNGTWTGAVSFAYQWQRCASSCSDIAGANASRYDITSSDAAFSLRAAVTATNAGGSTTVYTATLAVPASSGSSGGSSSGGSSSGGGGGGTLPNITVTALATPTAPLPGDTVTLAVTVTDKNSMPATKLVFTATIPSGMTYSSGSADRGSGCAPSATDATKVICNLDYLSSDSPVAHVLLYAKVTATGPLTVSVNALSQDLGDLDASDNTLAIALNAATTTTLGTPTGLNGDGTTSTKKTDKKAPSSQALSSSGRRGHAAQLRLKIYDDSGVAKAVATVKRNGKAVATAKTGFGPVAYGGIYYVGWNVPLSAPMGRYTFCVVALDRAAHQSRTTCAPLALR